MERYHIYRLGLAILFYAIYCPRPMVVNGSTFDDVIGTINDTNERLARALNADYGYEDSYQGVQGRPGVDFPVFGQIPRTTFNCQDLESGYYADLDTDCQVFHICNEGRKVSFLCPNGTIFQQSDLICDWWFKVNCTNSPNLYEESAENLKESNLRRKQFRKVNFQQDSSKESRGSFDSRESRRNSAKETQITQESASFYSNNAYTLQEVTEKGNKIFEGSKPYSQRNYDNVANHKRIYVDNPALDYTDNNQPKITVPTLVNSDINAAVQRHSNRNKANRGRNNYVSSTSKPSTVAQNFDNNSGYRATVTTTPAPIPVSSTKQPKQPTIYPPVVGTWQSDSPGGKSSKNDLKTASSSSLFNNKNQNTNSNINRTSSSRKKGSTIQLSLSSSLNSRPTSSSSRSKESPVVTSNRSAHGKAIKAQATLNSNDFKNDNKIKLTLSSSLSNNRPETSTKKSTQNKNYVYSPTVPPFTKQTQPVGHYITKDTSSTSSPVPLAIETSTFNSRSTPTQVAASAVKTTVSSKPFKASTTSTPQTVRSTTPGLIYKYTSGVGNTQGFPTSTEEGTTSTPTIPPFLSTTLVPKGFSFQETTTSTPNVEISNPSTRLPPLDYSSATTNPFSTTQYNAPTTPTTFASNTHITESILENVHNMINSLRDVEINEPKYVEPRPGLIVPPSAGPQTLHSLAIYFANALDSIVGNGTEELNNRAAEVDTESPMEVAATAIPDEADTEKVLDKSEEEIVATLLTRMTVDKYNMLFEEKTRAPETAGAGDVDVGLGTRSGGSDVNNDLEGQHSKYPVQTPRARQLAQVFTHALSAYLDDPSTFRRVLQEVRPTEPPHLPPISTTPETRESTIDFSLGTEEDEVLNFSDADVKPENARFPLPALTSTTTTTTSPPSTTTLQPNIPSIAEINDHFLGNALENNKPDASEIENLQSADSQSFVSHFNTLSRAQNAAPAAVRTPKKLQQNFKENEFVQPKEFQPNADPDKTTDALPTNHWTSSPEVTKLWETTLFVNPSAINTKLTTSPDNIEQTTSTSTLLPEIASTTLQTIIVDDAEVEDNASAKEVGVQESNGMFKYTFKTLPTIEVNSTEIRGLLIDFMNSSKSSGTPDQVKRILQKLNTTEEEFLKKMRQINKNPLTRRLILLLVSESDQMPEYEKMEMKSTLIKTILNVTDAEVSSENKPVYDALVNLSTEIQEGAASGLTIEHTINDTLRATPSDPVLEKNEQNQEKEKKSDSLKTLVDPYLVEGHHDTRALELLKSLYTIAAKWGK